MKVVILAGGLGTRLQEETQVKPKPMVEIGGHPILWHIMNIYAAHGFREFVVALGHKGEVIKHYFLNYYHLKNDLTVHLGDGRAKVHGGESQPWTVHLVDTGPRSETGGRVRRLRHVLGDEPFMLTYGDGVSNVSIPEVLRFHRTHGKIATVTAVRPPSRFGGLQFDPDGTVRRFVEKPQIGEGWINGGFMVFEPGVMDHIAGDEVRLEQDVLEILASKGHLAAYRHEGFWQCMDTLRDVRLLQSLWDDGTPPWKVWP